jgi:hypothetical protein
MPVRKRAASTWASRGNAPRNFYEQIDLLALCQG